MFCGDAAMNGFPSIGRTTIWIENLKQYRQSWETIIGKKPDLLFPAHGKPFKPAELQRNVQRLAGIRLLPIRP